MLGVFHSEIVNGEVILSREESHHLVTVRRARTGQTLLLLDGRGRKGKGRLISEDPKRARVQVESVERVERDTAPLWLAQALPLGKTMDVIVQKATELGAARILPLLSKNSEVRLDDSRAERKADKWMQVAIEAAKQCGNPFLPRIDPAMELSALLGGDLPPVRLVCSLQEGSQSMHAALSGQDCSAGVVIAIGPEGDFTPAEYDALAAHGFRPVTLGPLVLRADTAAIAALAVAGELLRTRT